MLNKVGLSARLALTDWRHEAALSRCAVLAGGHGRLHRLLQLGQAANDHPLPFYGTDHRYRPGKPEE